MSMFISDIKNFDVLYLVSFLHTLAAVVSFSGIISYESEASTANSHAEVLVLLRTPASKQEEHDHLCQGREKNMEE